MPNSASNWLRSRSGGLIASADPFVVLVISDVNPEIQHRESKDSTFQAELPQSGASFALREDNTLETYSGLARRQITITSTAWIASGHLFGRIGIAGRSGPWIVSQTLDELGRHPCCQSRFDVKDVADRFIGPKRVLQILDVSIPFRLAFGL